MSKDLSKRPSTKERGARRTISPEKRDMLAKEAELMFAQNLLAREKSKEHMFEKRIQHLRLVTHTRTKREEKWREKTKNSPFAINLVAESERITEENRIRQGEEDDRRISIETRKNEAKNEIILKALSEFSDLEALRREKRAIMDEEQRLKALLSLEKVTVSGKADRLVAERALRQRSQAKLEHRRATYKESLDVVVEEQRMALMKKFNLSGKVILGGTA